jgi:hypothetical protein
MATAIANTKKVAKPVEYETRPDGVTLALSHDEAQTLIDILDFIGGSSTLSRRKYSNSIQKALNAAGYHAPWDDNLDPPGVRDVDRTGNHGPSIYFTDL